MQAAFLRLVLNFRDFGVWGSVFTLFLHLPKSTILAGPCILYNGAYNEIDSTRMEALVGQSRVGGLQRFCGLV